MRIYGHTLKDVTVWISNLDWWMTIHPLGIYASHMMRNWLRKSGCFFPPWNCQGFKACPWNQPIASSSSQIPSSIENGDRKQDKKWGERGVCVYIYIHIYIYVTDVTCFFQNYRYWRGVPLSIYCIYVSMYLCIYVSIYLSIYLSNLI